LRKLPNYFYYKGIMDWKKENVIHNQNTTPKYNIQPYKAK